MPSSAIAIGRTIALAPERSQPPRHDAPIAARAPRTSLIDAEWEAASLASPVAEHRKTWPFPMFVPTIVEAPAEPVLSAAETSQTLRSRAPLPKQSAWRRALTVGAVALLGLGVGAGLLHGALAFVDGTATGRAERGSSAAPLAAALVPAGRVAPPPAEPDVAPADVTPPAVISEPPDAPSPPTARTSLAASNATPKAQQTARRAPAAASRRDRAKAPRPAKALKIAARRTDNPY